MTDLDQVLARVKEEDDALTALRDEHRRAETEAQRRRDDAVRHAHRAGASYAEIADVIGTHRSRIYQIVKGRKK
jgi:hypothetical protein